MLGAVVSLVLVVAAAFAVTQVGGVITLLFIAAVLFLAYRRLSLLAFTVTFTVLLAAYTVLGASSAPAGVWKGFLWLLLAGLWLLNVRPLRKALITRPFMKTYLKLLPAMSQTEKEALEAGTVWWDGELFTGAPRWDEAAVGQARRSCPPRSRPSSTARAKSCAACSMTGTSPTSAATCRRRCGSSSSTRGFFAMIIPKKYGGLEFSAYAHSCVLVKIASRSTTASSTVAVPNSLGSGGAAEPLRHRGAEEPLPAAPGARRGSAVLRPHRAARRLRRRAPFPTPASSAAASGRGARCSACKLNFSKRYITLAPVATVDRPRLPHVRPGAGCWASKSRPRHHLRAHSARHAGRHASAGATSRINIPFQNGPIQGKDVFVPLDCIIGGAEAWPAAAGACWSSSSRWAAASRCPPTPPAAPRPACGPPAPTRASAASSTCRSASSRASRRCIARMVGLTYTMDAARSVTAGAIDGGEKPSVPSAMLKYHVTEMGRQVANDAMDVHGGKGICLGPNNYLARGYEVGAGRDHGRGRQPPHPQPHHLRPGRDPLPSVRAARDERGPQPGPRAGRRRVRPRAVRPHRLHHLERGALLHHGAHARALHARARCRARPRATTSTSCASAPRSPSRSTSRC